MGDRYWLMQLIDAWNNVPHVPGTRTLGGKGGDFAIVGPTWNGALPEGVTELRMPTSLGIVAGRTYVSGPDDYAAVHELQDRYRLVPLDAWGSDWTPPAEVPVQPGVDMKTPVPRQVLAMTPETFFGRLNALLPANPPYSEDAPVMERIATLGIAPSVEFPWSSFDPAVQQAIIRRRRGREAGDPRPGSASGRSRQRLAGSARPRPLRDEVPLPGRMDVLRRRRQPDRGRLLPARDHRRHRRTARQFAPLHAALRSASNFHPSTPSGR